MMFLLTTQHVTLVCSTDEAVTLKPVRPPTEAEPTPPLQERRPERWLRTEDVGEIKPEATLVVVRPLDSDEAFACSGGILSLNTPGLAEAYHKASAHLVSAQYTTPAGRVHAITPEQRTAFLKLLPLNKRESLGQVIFDESAGLASPFVFRA